MDKHTREQLEVMSKAQLKDICCGIGVCGKKEACPLLPMTGSCDRLVNLVDKEVLIKHILTEEAE